MMNSKLANNSGSLAYSYGITRGNPQNSSLGLNPNLNIQDQYIENLLKQINFLNLQIKLLQTTNNLEKKNKERTKALELWVYQIKNQQPLVNHAVESNMKFQSMKGNLQSMVSEMITQNLLLENQNTAVNAQKHYLTQQLRKQEQRNYENRIDVQKQLSDSTEKLKAFTKRYQELKLENKKLTGSYNSTDQEYRKILRNDKIKSLLKEINTNLKQQEQDANEAAAKEKSQITKNNKTTFDKATNDFKQDPRYIQLLEQNQALKEKMRKSDKQLFDIAYKAKQMQELKSLAQRNITVQLELKKQAMIQLQKIQDLLAQKKEDFDRRLVDRKKLSDSQPETKRLEVAYSASQKQYDQIKKKDEMSENNYRKLRQQMLKMTTQLQLMKQENKQLIEKQTSLTPQANSLQAEMNREQVDLQIQCRQLQREKSTYYSSKQKLLKLEQELHYLTSKYEFLERNIHVDEDLQNLRIQQLRGITQNNTMVNQVIGQMMTKFDQMKKFAKDSSSIKP